MKKTITSLLLLCFGLNTLLISLFSAMPAYAQDINLPPVGTMLYASDKFTAPILKSITIDPANPLNIKFDIDTYNQDDVSKAEVEKLVSYFLAALTINKKDIWVNLSPYEQDRITNDNLAKTDLGKDLLQQDYILKQLSASLTNPKTDLGHKYWNEFSNIDSRFSTENTDLSKIWIVPEKAVVYENGASAYVKELSFDIDTMSEIDQESSMQAIVNEVKKDVNSGKNFSQLRQIFHSIVLAQWFKAKLKDSFYSQYINQNKTEGIELADKQLKDKIWNQYLESFKTGVYSYTDKIKDPYNGSIRKQKFFCGGLQSSSLKVELVSTEEKANYKGNKKTAEVELYSSKEKLKRIAKEHLPTFYKMARFERAKFRIRHERSPAIVLEAFKVFLEHKTMDELKFYANAYSRTNPRSHISLMVDCFIFEYSKKYLFDNIDEFILILKENWMRPKFTYKLFNMMRDSDYWRENNIESYSLKQLVEKSNTYSSIRPKSANRHQSFDSGTDQIIASSSIEIETLGYLAVGALTTALTLYKIFKKDEKISDYRAARAAYEDIWELHDYTYINSHKDDAKTHAAIDTFFSYGHFAMSHLVMLDNKPDLSLDQQRAVEAFLLKAARENTWHDFKKGLEYEASHSRFSALYILRNLLKHKIIAKLNPTFKLYGTNSDKPVLNKIKHMAKHDKDEEVVKIANDILDNYINPSSSAIKTIFADINLHKYIQYAQQLSSTDDKRLKRELEIKLREQVSKIRSYANFNLKPLKKILSRNNSEIDIIIYGLLKKLSPSSMGMSFIFKHTISSKELTNSIFIAQKILDIARDRGESQKTITVNVLDSYYSSEKIYKQESAVFEDYVISQLDKYQRMWPNQKVNESAQNALNHLNNGGIDSGDLDILTSNNTIKLAPIDISDLSGLAFAVHSID